MNDIELRDYFAAKALPVMMQHVAPESLRDSNWIGPSDFTQAALLSYEMAESMMDVRKMKPSERESLYK